MNILRFSFALLLFSLNTGELFADSAPDEMNGEIVMGSHLPRGLNHPELTDRRVLGVMSRISRADFVPDLFKEVANADRPLPIGSGQTISQPFIVAYMSQEARVSKGNKVLEIGTGSGYQAAVLSKLGAEVFTIEIMPELAKTASKRLRDLGYKNVTVRYGDGFEGWAEEAPFQAIVVTAAAPRVPEKLFEQLATGGRMVLPLIDRSGMEWMSIVTKKKDGSSTVKRTFPVRFVPMTGEIQQPREEGKE